MAAVHPQGPARRRHLLAREKRAQEILRVYRETRSFPIRHGDRPAVVHVGPRAARESRRATADGKRS